MHRDDEARAAGKSVPCLVCGKQYFPGLSSDKIRPVDDQGKKIPITRAEKKGYCSTSCQHEREPPRKWRK